MQKFEPLAIVTSRVRRQHQQNAVKFTYVPAGTPTKLRGVHVKWIRSFELFFKRAEMR
jgi:hypothetical protein